jgi:hypothetical protein
MQIHSTRTQTNFNKPKLSLQPSGTQPMKLSPSNSLNKGPQSQSGRSSSSCSFFNSGSQVELERMKAYDATVDNVRWNYRSNSKLRVGMDHAKQSSRLKEQKREKERMASPDRNFEISPSQTSEAFKKLTMNPSFSQRSSIFQPRTFQNLSSLTPS